jgi:Fe2+ transport system protein FeoA
MAAAPVLLTRLPAGSSARLLAADLLDRDCELLSALGLAAGCRFRVCRAGDPWILQVRSTRIGLADVVAQKILVVPEAP